MSGELKALRTELIATVDPLDGLSSYDHVPGRVMLPAAFVVPGSPYITAGLTFGAKHVRLALVILTGSSLNDVETQQLDSWIEDAQRALEKAGWIVEQVDAPRIEDLNGAEVLATTITVGTDATFT